MTAAAGRRLRLARRALGLTASELALELGCRRSELSHWEHGRRLLPVPVARTLFERHRVSLDFIYCGDEMNLPATLRAAVRTMARTPEAATRGRRAARRAGAAPDAL